MSARPRIERGDLMRVVALASDRIQTETPPEWAERTGVDLAVVMEVAEAATAVAADGLHLHGLFCTAFQIGFEVGREYPRG